MACGCFPIATDIPANSQWIENGSNGLLYRVADIGELAAAIERAVRDSEMRRAAEVVNRRIVETRADWRVCVRRMQETYHDAMARAGDSK
jgi:glycosyltransferase involved in cell wall biosynthesis